MTIPFDVSTDETTEDAGADVIDLFPHLRKRDDSSREANEPRTRLAEGVRYEPPVALLALDAQSQGRSIRH